MKILIIRNYPSYFDINRNTYNIQEIGLAKALIRNGHICDIVFWTENEENDVDYVFDDDKHITIYYRNGRNIFKNAIYINIDELIKGYDVIQLAEYNQLQSWMLAKKYPEKTVIYHGPYYSAFNKRYNMMCRLMDLLVLRTYKKNNTRFIVKSKLAEDFLAGKGIKKENITVSGVGIDLDALQNTENDELPDEIKKVMSCKAEIKLLYIGRLEPRRNIPFLFNVMKSIADKGFDAKLIIIGSGDDDYKNNAFDYAKRLGVYNKLLYIDKIEQKYLSLAYKNADVFLLPTYYEIFGMVLLEAMYFGDTVITTENGGSVTLIQSGKNGIVIPEFNAGKWADAVIRSYNDKKMKAEANKCINDRYTWGVLADCFIKTYNGVKNNEKI